MFIALLSYQGIAVIKFRGVYQNVQSNSVNVMFGNQVHITLSELTRVPDINAKVEKCRQRHT